MHTLKSLLVELFAEELPPKALKKLSEAFAQGIFDGLKARHLATDRSVLVAFATPRRLAVRVSAVRALAPDEEVTRKVMPVSVALGADGRPTDALRKSLAKLGRGELADQWPDAWAGADRLIVQPDGKAQAVFLRSLVRGAALPVGLQAALDQTLEALPIPKVMSYQLDDGWTSVSFVRPVHGLVALHGSDEVPVRAFGRTAARSTRGHRFEARLDPVVLQDADHYERQLEGQGAVLASFAARRSEIQRQLHAAAGPGLAPIEDEALLDEVTALVERPNVLACEFDSEFLAVPPECLILTMKANQKYFPLLGSNGQLTNKFLVVSNIHPTDPRRVIEGNQRVVRPRLADAKFFFDQDRKRTLEARVPGLARVVYHNQLGTLGERVERVRAIARGIGRQLGGEVLAMHADRAAQLAKADLLTDMVGEFPELQGVMGGYYARHDGLSEEVTFAIEDHYRPRFAGDALPRNATGLVVALADKLETLVGLFGIGQLPSGDKDPFALRRHGLGIIRIMIERRLPLSLKEAIALAQAQFAASKAGNVAELVADFLYERLRVTLRDQGYSASQAEAVLALRPDVLSDVTDRAAAVRNFSGLPEATSLAAANKRVGNILNKADGAVLPHVRGELLKEPAEAQLAQVLARVQAQADASFERGDYTASLQILAALKAPVDAFFDAVMVNADDAQLRANRLGLLAQLHAAMNRVADLSKLAVP